MTSDARLARADGGDADEERFSGSDWLFERKFDGIRLLAYKRDGDVQLFSRNRLPQALPAIAAAIATLPARE